MIAACAAAGASLAPWPGRAALLGLIAAPEQTLSGWLVNTAAGSPVEAALYRLMQLPGGNFLFRRSPREALPALTQLMAGDHPDPALWSLRALEDEQALDFDAAERDWQTWVEKAPDKAAANLDLANFYARRLKPQQELAALEVVGRTPATPQDRWTPPEDQQAWQAWERALRVVRQYALSHDTAEREYRGWEQRYPHDETICEQEFEFLLTSADDSAAADRIARVRTAFPQDTITPVKLESELAVKRGTPADGLAVYDKSFEPLWPAELVKDYYELLVQGRAARRTIDALHARIAADPNDLNDTARLFYIEQHEGKPEAAQAVLTGFRRRREASGAAWSSDELYTLARLEQNAGETAEAARFYYALAANPPTATAEAAQPGPATGLAGLAKILLTNPEQPLRVGAENLALYRNIATMDRGPGYLNGILSLFMNSDAPSSELAQEDQLAVAYFHRAKAADIVATIDKQYPTQADRAELHAELMRAYEAYSDNHAVIREGKAFLADFPHDPHRIEVALETADAYARTRQPDQEFALYQSLLKELAAAAGGVPLGEAETTQTDRAAGRPAQPIAPQPFNGAGSAEAVSQPAAPGVHSPQYAQVLDRYLSRLVALDRLPDALALLRGELDRNPQDPGLYEQLAQFLDQNALDSHAEEVYQKAIAQFQTDDWYAKLARFYLRQQRNADYATLTRKVSGIFSGTDLEIYLRLAPAPGRQLSLEVNLYANQRFPHDLTFVRNLLALYRRSRQQQEVDQLLWAHWSESADLRDQLFERLSSSGQLDQVLETLQQQSPQIAASQWGALAQSSPAAERFWVDACLWQSHFEKAVDPAGALSAEYPADPQLADTASSLYRSFAYFHPEDTGQAVAVENRLLRASPGDLALMASIGDIYADRGRFGDADPYWTRMADAHPGEADGYLHAATVFWDYFDFPHAIQELQAARQKLGNPTLFAYQAGAIDESKGDTNAAIAEYAAGALGQAPSDESRSRLLTLAARPATKATVESATAKLLQGPAPATTAITLRVSILDAEHRRDAMAQELKDLAARTESFDVLDAIGSSAQQESLPDVQQAALRREMALTSDPIQNMQLRYQLVPLLTAQGQTAAASAEIDAIDREHPKILGVVRATVDYDWDHERKPQAVQVLLDAANVAYPKLRQDFQLEAAGKLTDLGDYSRSQALLQSLLAAQPLDPRFVTAMAANYAKAGDQPGLEAFYRDQLAVVKASNLDPPAKLERTAELRRGMIAAAAALGNAAEAADQYIELINAYPDDANLAQEAALYAIAHQQKDRLFAFYEKTIQQSPRDPRWSIVLARLATAGEDFPTAIDAYGKAIALRPERQDLLMTRADLEARLQRFDDAVSDDQKLYTLSYRDPQWMEKVAEARARQGRSADAVQALRTAWIDGRPPKPENSFAVAAKLESWGMLDEARKFAEQGVDQVGADLLVSQQSGAATYARIMAHLRQTDSAFARLLQAREQAENVPLSAVAQQAVASGPGAVSPEEWREQRRQQRRNAAANGFAQAMVAMGQTVGTYDTPEEKSQFAAWLRKQTERADSGELISAWIPAAHAAGISDVEADLRWRLVELDNNKEGATVDWIALQKHRVQLDGVGEKIEALADQVQPTRRAQFWRMAADVDRENGDASGELRAMEKLANASPLAGEELDRFYALLLAQRPQELIQRAREDSAAQYLVVHGAAAQAMTAVDARAAGMPPVWRTAYTGITGLYRQQHTPEISKSFTAALDPDATIGERIDHPADRSRQLAGAVWFYYGSRYGEYLDSQKDPDAEGFLVSELEHTPEDSQAYTQLADDSAAQGRNEDALADYQRSLDVSADQPAVLDRMADVDWTMNRQADALAAWQSAVALLAKEMDAKPVPSTFWGDARVTMRDASRHGQFDAIRQPIDGLVRAYLARNGDYQAESLLEAGYHANGDSVQWLLQIVSGLSQERNLLDALHVAAWVRRDQASQILERIVELDRAVAATSEAPGGDTLLADEVDLAAALLDEAKVDQANAVLAQIPEQKLSSQVPDSTSWTSYWDTKIRVAEAKNTLAQLIAEWQKVGSAAPDPQTLRTLAASLDDAAQRMVMTYVYQRALDARDFTAPNFLGLAAIHLDDGDTPEALDLLRRMLLVSGDLYADMDSAAALLEDRLHPAEALAFLRPLAQASPWNAAYKVRLGAARLAVGSAQQGVGAPSVQDAVALLQAVLTDPKAEYAERVAAAQALKGHGAATGVGAATELALLAQAACPTTQQASQPYFVRARIAAAACGDNAAREPLLRAALATAPDDDPARLAYVWAAFAARKNEPALLAAEPILRNWPVYAKPPRVDSLQSAATQENGQNTNDGQNDDSAVDAGQPASPATVWLSEDDAGKLYLLAIQAREQQREVNEAFQLAQQALNRANTAPQKKSIEAERKRLGAILEREQQNAARAPAIHAQMEQDHVVAPRVGPDGASSRGPAQEVNP